MEDKKEELKKTNNGLGPGFMVILVVLFLIGIGLGFAAAKVIDLDVKEEPKEVEKEKKEDKKNLELSSDVKTKLERFVNAGSTYMVGGYSIIDDFKGGVTTVSKDTKIWMAFYNVYYVDKKGERNVKVSADEKSKITGQKPADIEPVDIIKISDFENEYEALFGEKAEYTLEDMEVCPLPKGTNKEADKFYLFHDCGGTTNIAYTSEITEYDSDFDYYYVHQVSKYKGEGTNEENKLVWKFDKDLKFVSTEKE